MKLLSVFILLALCLSCTTTVSAEWDPDDDGGELPLLFISSEIENATAYGDYFASYYFLTCTEQQQENMRYRIRTEIEENPARPTYKQDMINYLNATWKKYPVKRVESSYKKKNTTYNVETVSFNKIKAASARFSSDTPIDTQLIKLENKLEPELAEAYHYYSDIVPNINVDRFNEVPTIDKNTILDANGISEWRLTTGEIRELERIDTIMGAAGQLYYDKIYHRNKFSKDRSFRWGNEGHKNLILYAMNINKTITQKFRNIAASHAMDPDTWQYLPTTEEKCRVIHPELKPTDWCIDIINDNVFDNVITGDISRSKNIHYWSGTFGMAPELAQKYAILAKNAPANDETKYIYIGIASHPIDDVGNPMHSTGARQQGIDLVTNGDRAVHFVYEDWVDNNMALFASSINDGSTYKTGITAEQMVKENAALSREYFKPLFEGIRDSPIRETWYNDPVLKARAIEITKKCFKNTAYYERSLVNYVTT